MTSSTTIGFLTMVDLTTWKIIETYTTIWIQGNKDM